MMSKVIGITLGAAICGLVCLTLVLLAGHWISVSFSADQVDHFTIIAAVLGLGLIAMGLQMRQLRRSFLELPRRRK